MVKFVVRVALGLVGGLGGVAGGLGIVWLAGELVGHSIGAGVTGVFLLIVSGILAVSAIGLVIREKRLHKVGSRRVFRYSLIPLVATMLLLGMAFAMAAIGYAMIRPRYVV